MDPPECVDRAVLMLMFPDWINVPVRALDHRYEALCGSVNTKWMPRRARMLTNQAVGVIDVPELQDPVAGS